VNTIPTPEQLAAIKAACDPAQDAQANWLRLTGVNYDNPTPCPQVPKPMRPIEMFSKVVDATGKKGLVELGAVLVEIRRQIDDQDFGGAIEWLQVLLGAGKITTAEYTDIGKYMTDRRDGVETEPDPDWPPKVDWGTSRAEFGEPIPYAWVLEAMS